MRDLSFKIIYDGVTTRLRRLPHRRVWEQNTSMKKRLAAQSSFLPPTNRVMIQIPEKARESILVNTVMDFKNKPYVHESTGLTYYVSKEKTTDCGFLVADFDVLPPAFGSWEDLELTLRGRLDRLGIDGVFIRSATDKTKLLIPVIHDLPRLKHGASHHRLACISVVIGGEIGQYLDSAPAASKSAFFTRDGVLAFLRQTLKPLKGASLASLWAKSRLEPVPMVQTKEARPISGGAPTKTLAKPIGPNRMRSLAMTVAKGLVTNHRAPGLSNRGRPMILRRRQAVLAALLMLGGSASASKVKTLSCSLAGAIIPERSFSTMVRDLKACGIIDRSAKAIIKVRSAGLHLSPRTEDHKKVKEFYRLMGVYIYPKNGDWNSYLFNITGLFADQASFLEFVQRLPNLTERPDRLMKAKTCWANHLRRQASREEKRADIHSSILNSPHVKTAGANNEA